MPVDLAQAEFANEAFYLAFEAKDIDAMTHLWSERREVICLHPGWPVLLGRDAVLESWRSILENPNQGAVSFYNATCAHMSDEVAAVTCYEKAGNTIMVALNLFAEEDGRLRMVAHQAGFCANPPDPTP